MIQRNRSWMSSDCTELVLLRLNQCYLGWTGVVWSEPVLCFDQNSMARTETNSLWMELLVLMQNGGAFLSIARVGGRFQWPHLSWTWTWGQGRWQIPGPSGHNCSGPNLGPESACPSLLTKIPHKILVASWADSLCLSGLYKLVLRPDWSNVQ